VVVARAGGELAYLVSAQSKTAREQVSREQPSDIVSTMAVQKSETLFD
jgi:hypothetical protein